MTVVNIKINDLDIAANHEKTILQAALENGIEIPHLCFDERLKPYGACGLCVVEIEGSPKLVRSCATKVADGMVVKTDTPRTTATRKTALKLLISDHRGDCRPPCVLACPAHTDCQGYVGLIANGQYDEAAKLIKEQLPLPASIGRVCPHPCETACRRNMVDEPISIAALKRFVGDMALQGEGFVADKKPSTGRKAAIVGAGPSGLTCGYFLAREGHDVTIFEAMPKPGGMLMYGIPEYRLPKEILVQEIELIKKMGVEIKCNTMLGRDISLDGLKQEYDAVYLAVGAWESSGMRCKGEDMEGVIGGIDFLRDTSARECIKDSRVLVVGGGNTAMDVARTAVRLGADKVSVIYRRTRDEMPAEDIEIDEAEEEGVEFNFLYAPVEVTGSSRAAGLRCQRMRLGEADASGRRKPEPIPGGEVVFDADYIIAAIGQKVALKGIDGLELSKYGTIEVGEGTFETNIPGVFAGGDAVTGPRIAIEAIAQGRQCAAVIDGYLHGNIVPIKEAFYVTQDDLTEEDFADRPKAERVRCSVLDPDVRKHSFDEVACPMTEEQAKKEASRCLECGCRDYFECRLLNYIHKYDVDPENIRGEKHKRKEDDNHPFIERNPDKCILCGLCVRACDEIMGITALGLVDRGFDSVVKPEFGMPLKESSCISCGLCASVCPTGACMERQAADKQVPLEFEDKESICSYCGIGCRLKLNTKGNMIYRSLPYGKDILCSKGRFGIIHINDGSRILKPVVRNGKSFEETSFDRAAEYLAERLTSVSRQYGRDSVAISVSPDLTNEELAVVKEIAAKLGTRVVGSFTNVLHGISSTARLDDIKCADLIVTVGSVHDSYPVLGADIKDALSKGAYAKELCGCETADGLPDHAVKAIDAAQRPIVVIDENALSAGSAAKIAVQCGGKCSIIVARAKSNSQGIVDMGMAADGGYILEGINSGSIKALVVLGENVAADDNGISQVLGKLDFLAAADLYMTETAELSHLVLPFSSFAENGGSYTRCDGMVQHGAPAVNSKTGRTNLEILENLSRRIDPNIRFGDNVEKAPVQAAHAYMSYRVYSTIDMEFKKFAQQSGISI